MIGWAVVWWRNIVEFLILFLARTFPSRYRMIPRLDGKPLLRQFLVCKLGRFVEVYLQSFLDGETAEWFHVHRWGRMISFVLSGRFCEERFPGGPGLFLVHSAPGVYTMDQSTIHRLHWTTEKTWTLFFAFDNDGSWGYYRRPTPEALQYTPWQQMIPPEKRIKSL